MKLQSILRKYLSTNTLKRVIAAAGGFSGGMVAGNYLEDKISIHLSTTETNGKFAIDPKYGPMIADIILVAIALVIDVMIYKSQRKWMHFSTGMLAAFVYKFALNSVQAIKPLTPEMANRFDPF